MTILLIGIIIFGGIHLFSMLAPEARDRLKERWGEGPWKGFYSLVSLVGLGLMIWGYARAKAAVQIEDLLYIPGDWTRHAAMLLVLIAFIAVGSSHGKGHIKLWLKQPMSIGFALWAGAHLLANGELADLLLCGTILVLALLDIVLSTARGKLPQYQPNTRSDIMAVGVGAVLYLVFLFGFHPYILGVPVV